MCNTYCFLAVYFGERSSSNVTHTLPAFFCFTFLLDWQSGISKFKRQKVTTFKGRDNLSLKKKGKIITYYKIVYVNKFLITVDSILYICHVTFLCTHISFSISLHNIFFFTAATCFGHRVWLFSGSYNLHRRIQYILQSYVNDNYIPDGANLILYTWTKLY